MTADKEGRKRRAVLRARAAGPGPAEQGRTERVVAMEDRIRAGVGAGLAGGPARDQQWGRYAHECRWGRS